jgi:hypothetical protein
MHNVIHILDVLQTLLTSRFIYYSYNYFVTKVSYTSQTEIIFILIFC